MLDGSPLVSKPHREIVNWEVIDIRYYRYSEQLNNPNLKKNISCYLHLNINRKSESLYQPIPYFHTHIWAEFDVRS